MELMMITDQEIRSTLATYAFHPSGEECAAIRTYISLLLRWNRRISLTAVVDPMEVLRFHFGESLFAISYGSVKEGRLADVGSGAGFPGLALKIGMPALDTTLLEPHAKRAAFLSEIIRQLDLGSSRVLRKRFEEIGDTIGPFEIITSRALGEHADLIHWSQKMLSPGGRVILWVGERDARELSLMHGLDWAVPRLIPSTKNRYLLVGRPIDQRASK